MAKSNQPEIGLANGDVGIIIGNGEKRRFLFNVFSEFFFFTPLFLLSSYFAILLLTSMPEDSILPIPGIFLAIITLHASFSLGLLTGLLPMKPPTNERIKNANNSNNEGRN